MFATKRRHGVLKEETVGVSPRKYDPGAELGGSAF